MTSIVISSKDSFYQAYYPTLKSNGIINSSVIQIIDDYCCYKPTGKELADRLKKINETNKGLCAYADYVQMVAFFGYPLRQLIIKRGLENFHFVNVCRYYFETIARKNGYSDQFEKLEEIVHNIFETNDLVEKLPKITETLLVLKKVLVYAYKLINNSKAYNISKNTFLSIEFKEKTMAASQINASIIKKTKNAEEYLFFRKYHLLGKSFTLNAEEAGPWLQKYPSFENEIIKLNELLNHIHNNNKGSLKSHFKALLVHEIFIKDWRLKSLLKINQENFQSLLISQDVKNVLEGQCESNISKRYSNDFLKAKQIFRWLENNASLDSSKINEINDQVNQINMLGNKKDESELIYAIASSALDKRYYDKYSFSEFYNLQPEDLKIKELESLYSSFLKFQHKESKGIDPSFNVTIKKKASVPPAPKAKKNKKFDYAKETKEPEPTPQSQATPSAKSKNQLKAILNASKIKATQIKYAPRVIQALSKSKVKGGKERENVWAHGFTTQLDRFLETSYCYSWVKGEERHYALSVLVEDSGEMYTYFATYTFSKEGICYHRCLQRKTREEHFNALGSEQVYKLIEWPTLQSSYSKSEERASVVDTMNYDPVTKIVTVQDEKHHITLKVLPKA